MAKGNRDEFTEPVKRVLCERVNGTCCNPGCGQSTRGASSDPNDWINIGCASHIEGAAPLGPRYNAALTPEERSAAENGIWLCRNCGTLVDDDHSAYTVDELRAWKRNQEARAREAITKPSARGRDESPLVQRRFELDVKRWEEFIGKFPSQSGPVAAVAALNVDGWSYRRSILENLLPLMYEWNAPERQFYNERLRVAMEKLVSAAIAFYGYASCNTWCVGADCDRMHVPPEWEYEKPELFRKTVDKIHVLTAAVAEAHAEVIRSAREELGV